MATVVTKSIRFGAWWKRSGFQVVMKHVDTATVRSYVAGQVALPISGSGIPSAFATS